MFNVPRTAQKNATSAIGGEFNLPYQGYAESLEKYNPPIARKFN